MNIESTTCWVTNPVNPPIEEFWKRMGFFTVTPAKLPKSIGGFIIGWNEDGTISKEKSCIIKQKENANAPIIL